MHVASKLSGLDQEKKKKNYFRYHRFNEHLFTIWISPAHIYPYWEMTGQGNGRPSA